MKNTPNRSKDLKLGHREIDAAHENFHGGRSKLGAKVITKVVGMTRKSQREARGAHAVAVKSQSPAHLGLDRSRDEGPEVCW